MDAFYASVEQRDNPELRGKPIAVGGGAERGVTTTASYEARKFGVKSAMPGYKAKQLCPSLIFVKPRFEAYKEVSNQVRQIFKDYTELIEPLSLDEAYLDVSQNKKDIPYAMDVAQEIMNRVRDEIQITCSAGVSYCKFLAKIASDYHKPNGMTIIRPSQAEAFLEELPIEKFFGVGKVTARKMNQMDIFTGADLKKFSKIELAQKFGKAGTFYYNIVRGWDDRPVNSNRIRKSIGVERTFRNDLSTKQEIESVINDIANKFFERLQKNNNYGRTITLKLKSSDFKIITRSRSKNYYIKNYKEIESIAQQLFEDNEKSIDKIRLIGLTASNLESEIDNSENYQLSIEW
jgi:DNA polymerase-4